MKYRVMLALMFVLLEPSTASAGDIRESHRPSSGLQYHRTVHHQRNHGSWAGPYVGNALGSNGRQINTDLGNWHLRRLGR